jgi:hypothetical protein
VACDGLSRNTFGTSEDAMKAMMQEVPPPTTAPVDDIAETLGLCDGLRPWKADHQSRCSNCDQMQRSNSWMVWVPDSVKSSDPDWSVTEACRLNAYNGHSSGWCLKCALGFSKKALRSETTMTTARFIVFYVLLLAMIFMIGYAAGVVWLTWRWG